MEFGVQFFPAVGPALKTPAQYWGEALHLTRLADYSFEAANPRHAHEWRVWETVKLAPGKILIPGVISHATNIVEHPELVAERIVRLAKIVGRENVMAGTDCGFAQSPFARRVHPTIMWAKLKSLVEGARIATQVLWGKQAAA
jgi:5-methyltetrahydropteroyltriglutamate--homocysteine methyltransferase